MKLTSRENVLLDEALRRGEDLREQVPIAFKNLGNAPVDVELGVPSNPDFVRIAAGFHLDPGQEASPSYRFSPSQWSVETASANVVTKGPVCGVVLWASRRPASASAAAGVPFRIDEPLR